MAKTKKRIPAQDRKKQILKCAVKVFARSNYRTAKVADIAAKAGISEALIYKYFPSKKSIFLEILEHMSKRIIIFWQEEVDKEPDALKAMHNMGVTYYKRMIKHPDELKVQFQAISEINDKEIAKRLHQDHVNYMSFIRKVIEKGIQQGAIRKNLDVDIPVWVMDSLGVFMNIMKLLSFEKEFTEEMLIKITDHLIESMRP